MNHSHAFYLLKLLRPRQWIKNLALFTGITFGGLLFDGDSFSKVIISFIAFCCLSSATYIINDVFDLEKDRQHPFKRLRPLASGKVSLFEAALLFVFMLGTALLLSFYLGGLFMLIGLIYILMQIIYSLGLKGVAIFDIFFIATGYILRVLAGGEIVNYHISVWLLLTTVSLSLFLAVGKRRSELTLLKHIKTAKIEEVRKSLSHYSEGLLDAYTVIFSTATIIFYTMFTYLEHPRGMQITLDVLLPQFLPYYLQRKWLMITIIPIIYGMMRYMQDIYEKSEGESPDRVLLSDKALLTSVIIWVLMLITIVYFIG
jgi:4-hydroxybenzoate polyprenyltransferase